MGGGIPVLGMEREERRDKKRRRLEKCVYFGGEERRRRRCLSDEAVRQWQQTSLVPLYYLCYRHREPCLKWGGWEKRKGIRLLFPFFSSFSLRNFTARRHKCGQKRNFRRRLETHTKLSSYNIFLEVNILLDLEILYFFRRVSLCANFSH